MLIDLKRNVAFICPYCLKVSMSLISVFGFSGQGGLRLICAQKNCGKECAAIFTAKNKYHISVSCPVCGEVHSFEVIGKKFWSSHLIRLKCPRTALDIFFIGEGEKVEKAVEKQINEINEMIYAEDEQFHEDIISDMLDVLYVMLEEGDIRCRCKHPDVQVVPRGDSVMIHCYNCGRSTVLPESNEVYEKLIDMDKLVVGSKLE